MRACAVCEVTRCPLSCGCVCHDLRLRTDRDHRPSRKLFAAEPDPVRELSVADWIGGQP